jgi:D-alanine--poly(phosphoribitol) ligase subunit 1
VPADHDVPSLSRMQKSQATSLFDLFSDSRHACAERPALWVKGCVYTYAQLYDRAAGLAGAILATRDRQTSHGQYPCGLLVNRSFTAYVAVLASLMLGRTYVPLNPKFPSDRLRQVVLSSMLDTVIVDRDSAAAAASLLESLARPMTVLLPDSEMPDWAMRARHHRYVARTDIECVAPALPTNRRPENGAYLLFTSGSTGIPKGVLISHDNALAYIRNMTSRYRPGPDDRFSQLFDFSFDLSVHDMFLAWSAGACLYCAPEGSLIGLSDFINRCRLTFWFSVPSTAAFMRQLRMLKPHSYPSLRWSLFCGEALPMRLARSWQEAAPNSIVENLYGPTETTVAFTAYRLPRECGSELDALPTVPIGTPLPDQRVMVVDGRGDPLPDDEAGELCLGGSQVAAGYWRAPEQTAARFRPPRCANAAGARWYRTGDRAVMTRQYGLVFLGRVDRQAKIRGHRVELLEVENAMRVAAGTDTVAAIPWPVGTDGLALGLVGFVVGSQTTVAEILDACRSTLPDYMVPSEIYQPCNWPINANGKTDYTALNALLDDGNVGL